MNRVPSVHDTDALTPGTGPLEKREEAVQVGPEVQPLADDVEDVVRRVRDQEVKVRPLDLLLERHQKGPRLETALRDRCPGK